jgi:hypothetical protein
MFAVSNQRLLGEFAEFGYAYEFAMSAVAIRSSDAMTLNVDGALAVGGNRYCRDLGVTSSETSSAWTRAAISSRIGRTASKG